MDTESQRIYDRMSLHRLSVAHPDWKAAQLAEAIGRSERWARKWLSRFKESEAHQFSLYLSQSGMDTAYARKSPKSAIVKVIT